MGEVVSPPFPDLTGQGEGLNSLIPMQEPCFSLLFHCHLLPVALTSHQTLSFPRSVCPGYKTCAPVSLLSCSLGWTFTLFSPCSQLLFLKLISPGPHTLTHSWPSSNLEGCHVVESRQAGLRYPLLFVVFCFPIFQGLVPLSFGRGAW